MRAIRSHEILTIFLLFFIITKVAMHLDKINFYPSGENLIACPPPEGKTISNSVLLVT